MMIRSKAPLRISFAGGGTDVSPYMEEQGGIVLSATMNKYAYGSLRLHDDPGIAVQSLDYNMLTKYQLDDQMVYDGKLDAIKAVIKTMNKDQCHGLDLLIHSDAPPGSGLGSSSTMVVTVIGLLKHWHSLPMTDYDIAELAYAIERKELDIQGGMQDQYAAVFGGFNFIEFGQSSVIVNPLRINPDVINELQYNLLLCYTGQTRLSANIISTQIDGYVKQQTAVLKAMEELKCITVEMKNALLQGRLFDFGYLLHEAWINKKQMAKQITNPGIDKMYETARAHGAVGGKILGAGGGGYLLIYCQYNKHIIARELQRVGGEVVDFAFENNGLQTWEVKSPEVVTTPLP